MINNGASDELIAATELDMCVIFPEGLKLVWRKSNGFGLPGGWRLYPVFEPKEPYKTGNHIGYENTKGRWPSMDCSLVSIAGGDTGNQLVLKIMDNKLTDEIYLWNSATKKIRPWSKDFGHLLSIAESRRALVEQNIFLSANTCEVSA